MQVEPDGRRQLMTGHDLIGPLNMVELSTISSIPSPFEYYKVVST
jgi:hypothetical protein